MKKNELGKGEIKLSGESTSSYYYGQTGKNGKGEIDIYI